MQASDNSLGLYLRSEREQQGMDIKDIASLTKIQPKFIAALEGDDYDRLPKGPFVIGFLRSYAQCLSLDADEVVAFFQARDGMAMQSPSGRQRLSQQRPAATPRTSSRRGAALSVGLAALGCVLLWVLWNGLGGERVAHDRPAETANGQAAAGQVVSAPEFTPLPTLQETTAPNAAALPALSTLASLGASPIATDVQPGHATPWDTPDHMLSEASAPEPAPLVLRVQALEETWVRLDIDDEIRREALIQAGQSVEWEAKEQFSLTIGNVEGTRVLLNDRELDLPLTRSNVLRDYVLTRALSNPRRTH